MSLLKKVTKIGLMLGFVLIMGASAASIMAQQPTTATQDGGLQQERMKRRGMGKRGGGILRLASQLNLTDAQQQQLRAIEERFEANTKPQREELRRLHESTQGTTLSADTEARFQALRTEMRQAMRSRHEEMIAVLSTEQRAQFEQLIKERKARRGERRGRALNQQQDEQ